MKAQRVSAHNSGKKSGRGKSEGSQRTQFSSGNEHQFKSKVELAGEVDPRINIGGRPKVMTEASKKVMESRFPRELISDDTSNIPAQLLINVIDEYAGKGEQITYAEKAALELAWQAANGNQDAITKVAHFTEGAKGTWQGEIIALLREGKITSDIVIAELGNELATTILVAAGIRRNDTGQT